MKSEDVLQAAIYRWYHNTYCTKNNNPKHCIFSVPNGGFRTSREAMKLKATGLVAGVSDVIVIQPNRIVFVEVKLEKGKQQQNQIEFENTVKALGFEYYVVRSLEEFKNIITK
jgi:hypothetical protein